MERRDRTDNKTSKRKCTRRRQVRGNQKDKKGKSSEAANPSLAVMAQVPKASGKGNRKGASHTHAADMKSASHTHVANFKGDSHTHASEGMKATSSSLLGLSESKEGASNTPPPTLARVQRMMMFSLVLERNASLKEEKMTKPKERRIRWPPLWTI